MLNRRHARAHGEFDSFGAVRMRGDFSLKLICLVDERFQLFKTVLSCADRVAFRQHTAGRTSLDHIGAVFDLQAHRLANLLRSVGDAINGPKLQESRSKTVLVTVAARNSDSVTGSFHARPGRPAFIDGFAQGHVVEASRGADVPDRKST